MGMMLYTVIIQYCLHRLHKNTDIFFQDGWQVAGKFQPYIKKNGNGRSKQ